jgi:hypothetical protein
MTWSTSIQTYDTKDLTQVDLGCIGPLWYEVSNASPIY